MRTLAAALAAIALAGCGLTHSSKTYGPSGKEAHSISCRGAANTWASCYERAGEICGRAGYDLVARDGEVTPFGMASGYANSSGGSFSGFSGGAVSRSMLIQCRAPV